MDAGDVRIAAERDSRGGAVARSRALGLGGCVMAEDRVRYF